MRGKAVARLSAALPLTATASLAALGLFGALLVTVAPAHSAGSDGPTPTVPTPTPTPTPTPIPAVPTTPTAPIAAPVLDPNAVPTPIPSPSAIPGVPTAAGGPSPFTKVDPAANAASLFKPKKSNGERLFGKLGRGLNVSGGGSLHFQNDAIRGAAQYYTDQNLTGQDFRSAGVNGMQQTMDMTIQGKVFNAFNVNAHLSNSRYGNSFSQVFGFDYKSKGTSFDIGNVTASLPGNELVPFSRSVQGIVVGRDFGNHTTTTNFATITRATTQHGSFVGQGTSGPYYMNASQIIQGSEKVLLNGKELTEGEDYNIDPKLGQITFLKGLIVNQADTVQFTYESETYNTVPGILAGSRVQTLTKSSDAVGVTIIKQKIVGVDSNHDGTVTQFFPVYPYANTIGGVADPQYKYYLSSSIDPRRELTLKWQNETLVQNVDYVLNQELHYFQLKKTLPADTSITGITSLSCTYRPVQVDSVAGDKQVMGIDTKLRLSQNATLALNYAGSQAQSENQTGTGLSMTAAWHSPSNVKKNAWAASTTIKSIGDTFSSIDSTQTGFFQAQKGVSTSFTFTPNERYNITTSLSDQRVAATNTVATLLGGTTATSANSVQWAHNQGLNAGLNVTIPHLPTLSLTHAQTVQSGGGSLGHSSFINDGLTATWTLGKLGLIGGVANTATTGVSVFSSAANNSVATATTTSGTLIDQANNGTFSQTISSASSLTSRLSATFTPSPILTLNSNVGVSRNRTGTSGTGGATSGSLSTARDFGWGVRMQPIHQIDFTWNTTDSTNGQSTAAFTNTATASAAAGTSPVTSQLVNSLTGQETRSNDLTLQYTPFTWVTAVVGRSTHLSLIPGSDNSESASTSFNLNVNPTQKVQLSLGTRQERVTFVGGEGDSNNKSLTFTANAGQFGKTSYNTTITRSDYGSATYTTVTTPTGSVLSGTTTAQQGLLQQGVSTSVTLGTTYAIGATRSLIGEYTILDLSSPSSYTGSANVTGSTAYASTNYLRGTSTIGLNMHLTDIVAFQVNFNLIDLHDKDNAKASYHARSITTDLSARF